MRLSVQLSVRMFPRLSSYCLCIAVPPCSQCQRKQCVAIPGFLFCWFATDDVQFLVFLCMRCAVWPCSLEAKKKKSKKRCGLFVRGSISPRCSDCLTVLHHIFSLIHFALATAHNISVSTSALLNPFLIHFGQHAILHSNIFINKLCINTCSSIQVCSNMLSYIPRSSTCRVPSLMPECH